MIYHALSDAMFYRCQILIPEMDSTVEYEMSASNLIAVKDRDWNNTFKDFLKTHFGLKDKDNNQIEIEIDEPLADTNTIIMKFNIDADLKQNISTKLGDLVEFTTSLNDFISKELDPNIEITNVKAPKIIPKPSGSTIYS